MHPVMAAGIPVEELCTQRQSAMKATDLGLRLEEALDLTKVMLKMG